MKNKEISLLVNRVRQGDEDAFAQLYNQLWSGCYYLACKHLNDPEEAKDIVQDSFLKARESLSKLKADIAFSAWLSRIILNKCIDSKRSKARNMQPLSEWDDSLVEERKDLLPDGFIQEREAYYAIAQLVQELPEEQKTATILFYYNQLSNDEVASVMDISSNAARLKLSRARATIKEKLLVLQRQGAIPLFAGVALPNLLQKAFQHDATTVCSPQVQLEIWEKIKPLLIAGASSGVGAGAAASKFATMLHKISLKMASIGVKSMVIMGAVTLVGIITWAGVNLVSENKQAMPLVTSAVTNVIEDTAQETTTVKEIKVIEDVFTPEDASTIRRWESVTATNYHEDFVALISEYGFVRQAISIYKQDEGKAFILYTLEKDNKRILLGEYYSVGLKEWQVVWRITDHLVPYPAEGDLESWFKQSSEALEIVNS